LNQVIGILHLRRTSRFLSLPREFNKAELMRQTEEPYFIPEGTPLSTQLVNFQKHKERIALIVDEYGDVIGLLTLDDILEEIVGKFTTDYASEIEEMHLQEDGSYYIKGSSLLREVNRTLEWELPT
ncbi:MAG TPA: magnesium/cobalt efflux protein, partial [Gammaproteobacteria bacterium]|nr:magnesium/cobalt efflux protein [Gammaproteobacteria bacterium]